MTQPNLMFPQAGIITSLDKALALAKVVLPLFKIETGWIPVATNLLYETGVTLGNVTLDTPSVTTVTMGAGSISAPSPCPGSFSGMTSEQLSGEQAAAPSGSVQRVDYGTLAVGDEVVIIFVNGNLNDGRVIARIA